MNKKQRFSLLLYVIVLFASCKSTDKDQNKIVTNMDESLTFKIDKISLTIDPNDGAKDISLNAYGVELLTGRDVKKEYYGNSLWLSPQKDFWPQPDILDYKPYTISELESGRLFTSQLDKKNGFQYFKEIKIDEEKHAFIHHYSIRNISDTLKSCAAWEVTRHLKTGVSFFPVSEFGIDRVRAIDPSIPTIEKDGLMWHTYDSSQLGHPGGKSKTFAFGAEGWLAYVLEDVLLIKQFPNYPPEQVAPGESDVEIYVCADFDYIELEEQSEYRSLNPGEEMEWTVTWYIRQIPENIQIMAGSSQLVKFVRSVLK